MSDPVLSQSFHAPSTTTNNPQSRSTATSAKPKVDNMDDASLRFTPRASTPGSVSTSARPSISATRPTMPDEFTSGTYGLTHSQTTTALSARLMSNSPVNQTPVADSQQDGLPLKFAASVPNLSRDVSAAESSMEPGNEELPLESMANLLDSQIMLSASLTSAPFFLPVKGTGVKLLHHQDSHVSDTSDVASMPDDLASLVYDHSQIINQLSLQDMTHPPYSSSVSASPSPVPILLSASTSEAGTLTHTDVEVGEGHIRLAIPSQVQKRSTSLNSPLSDKRKSFDLLRDSQTHQHVHRNLTDEVAGSVPSPITETNETQTPPTSTTQPVITQSPVVEKTPRPARPLSIQTVPTPSQAPTKSSSKPPVGPFLVSPPRYKILQSTLPLELLDVMDFTIDAGARQSLGPTAAFVDVATINVDNVAYETDHGKTCVKSGSLVSLVNLLSAQGVTDSDFMSDFVRTYRYFSDSFDVARLLALRYMDIEWKLENGELKSPTSPKGGNEAEASAQWATFQQLRVLNVFKKWLEAHPDDFSKSPRLTSFLTLFLESHVAKDPKRAVFTESLIKLLKEKTKDPYGFSSPRSYFPTLPGMPAAGTNNNNNNSTSNTSSASRARMLTKRESSGSLNGDLSHSRTMSESMIAPKQVPNLRGALRGTTSHSRAPSNPILGSKPSSTLHVSSTFDERASVHSVASSTGSNQGGSSSPSLSSQLSDMLSNASLSNGVTTIRRKASKASFKETMTVADRAGMNPAVSNNFSLSLALSMIEPPPPMNIVDMDPAVLAQQLTLMEHAQFKRIKIDEMFEQAWMKAPSPVSAAGEGGNARSRLVALIGWFNRVAYFVASEVVSRDKQKDRVTTLKRFITVADCCLKWNNFNTLFEVVAGLNLGPVTRLKKTWKALPSKYVDMWNNISKATASEGSYKNYRAIVANLKDRPSDVPMLPYLGVNLKDLTFAEDGNPTFIMGAATNASTPTNTSSIGATTEVINFTKFRMISRLLDGVLNAQQGDYVNSTHLPTKFSVDDKIQRWIKTDWVILDSKEMYDRSLACEPRLPS